MAWMDMGIDRTISEVDIRRGWADAFNLPVDAIAVTPDWGDLDRWGGPEIRIAIGRFEEAGGDFPLTLSVVLRDDDMISRVATNAASVGVVQRFCAALGCRVILSSNDDDQSTWTLVAANGIWRVRGYDPDDTEGRLADAHVEPLAVVAA